MTLKVRNIGRRQNGIFLKEMQADIPDKKSSVKTDMRDIQQEGDT